MISILETVKETLEKELKEEQNKFENLYKSNQEFEQELESLRPLKEQLKCSKQEKSDLETKFNKLEIHIKEKDETLTILKTEKETLETNLNELRTTSSDSNAQIQADLKGKITKKN